MLISMGTLARQSLAGKVAPVTGAGGGIGFEVARALIWLGARVVIAEINSKSGRDAASRLLGEFGVGAARFIRTDVGDERRATEPCPGLASRCGRAGPAA